MSVPLVRTLVLYFAVICAVRLMGKRQLGEMAKSGNNIYIITDVRFSVNIFHCLTFL